MEETFEAVVVVANTGPEHHILSHEKVAK